MTWCKFSAVACVATALLTNRDVHGEEIDVVYQGGQISEEVQALVDDCMNRIWQIDVEPPSDPADEFERFLYWIDIQNRGYEIFNEMRLKSGRDSGAALAAYFAKCGEGTAQDKMRWLMAGEELLFPTKNGQTFAYRGEQPPHVVQQIEIAETQVRTFLRHPDVLDKYYRVVVWRRFLFFSFSSTRSVYSLTQIVEEGFAENYWCNARNTLLLLHGTGRDDLARDVEPTQLDDVFADWKEWFEENGQYLVASSESPIWVLDERAKEAGHGSPEWDERHVLPELHWPCFPFECWNGIPPILDGRKHPDP